MTDPNLTPFEQRLVFERAQRINVDTLEFAQELMIQMSVLRQGLLMAMTNNGIQPKGAIAQTLLLIENLMAGNASKLSQVINPPVLSLGDLVMAVREEILAIKTGTTLAEIPAPLLAVNTPATSPQENPVNQQNSVVDATNRFLAKFKRPPENDPPEVA